MNHQADNIYAQLLAIFFLVIFSQPALSATKSVSELPSGNLVAIGNVKNMGSGYLIQAMTSNSDTRATDSVSNKTDRIKKQYSQFQKLNDSGNAIPNISSSWSCVLDNETDLIWEVKTLGGIRDDYLEYSWKKAHTFVDAVNQTEGSGYCGSREWRLPTRDELMSLIDHRFDPTINTEMFPNSYDTNYWTGEVLPKWRISAWTVDFSDGTHMNWNKHWNWSVRLVRNK